MFILELKFNFEILYKVGCMANLTSYILYFLVAQTTYDRTFHSFIGK